MEHSVKLPPKMADGKIKQMQLNDLKRRQTLMVAQRLKRRLQQEKDDSFINQKKLHDKWRSIMRKSKVRRVFLHHGMAYIGIQVQNISEIGIFRLLHSLGKVLRAYNGRYPFVHCSWSLICLSWHVPIAD